ncbi:hypothetical protein [Aeromicrobium sp. 179-A 4D2 NHS]|uniref:hypothetical protein n=1 Tax=Aeromicrobium sp. 179-A 4D2 NHS TaxID=3142375 RepID=UPI0039A19F80
MQQLQAMVLVMGYQLVFHDGGPKGATSFDNATVSVRRNLTEAEARVTYLHELVHTFRGPAHLADEEAEEEQVELLTSRLLIPRMENGLTDHLVRRRFKVDAECVEARRRPLREDRIA